MPGLGVDLHPVYQRGTNALPDVEYGWLKLADGAAVYRTPADALAKLFRDRGIPFGGYEFAQPGTDGARAFDVLWAECQRLGAVGVTPAVDIEGVGWSPATAAQRGKAFCARARARGVRPAVYMDLGLLQATRPDLWPESPVIWAPRYGARPEVGGRYTGRYDVHQFSSTGTLPGSAGAVDWNQQYTTAHLLGGAPAPVPASQFGEDAIVQLKAKLDDTGAPVKTYAEIPVAGGKFLHLAVSFGKSVTVHGVTGVYDTNHSPQTVTVANGFTLAPDRPGPINGQLPDGLSHVVVEYTAPVDFTGWVA